MISGDFNLFAKRRYYQDTGGTQFGGLAIEVLEDVVREFNRHLKERICTYNISCSSPARSTFQHVAHGDTDVDLDCLLLISIFYNKQQFEEPWPPLLLPERRLAHDYLHNVLDRPHKLSSYDFVP